MINNINDLIKIRDEYAGKIAFRQGTAASDGNFKKHVLICGGIGETPQKHASTFSSP